MTGVKGTFRWMVSGMPIVGNVTIIAMLHQQAPELINTGANLTATATFASDVYALGMVRCTSVVPLRPCINSQQ